MAKDSVKSFIDLKQRLVAEKAQLEQRLKAINEALGASLEAPVLMAPAAVAKRGRRSGNAISLLNAVVQVTSQHPMTKEEILEAVGNLGYRFKTKKPLLSLSQILYGKKPKFNREGGKFSPANVVAPNAVKARKPRRKVSAAGRKNIAAAAKARWAKAKAAKAKG